MHACKTLAIRSRLISAGRRGGNIFITRRELFPTLSRGWEEMEEKKIGDCSLDVCRSSARVCSTLFAFPLRILSSSSPLAASCSGPPPRKQCDARSCGSPDGVTFFRKQTALPPPQLRSSLNTKVKEGGLNVERERELVFLSLKYSPAQCRPGLADRKCSPLPRTWSVDGAK